MLSSFLDIDRLGGENLSACVAPYNVKLIVKVPYLKTALNKDWPQSNKKH